MRIVTWNCKLGLDRKWPRLQALAPDISIIQECASPEILRGRGVALPPDRSLWTAKAGALNGHKGLGVFAGEGVEIRPAPQWAEIAARWAEQPWRLDVLLPFEVIRPRRLNILAVWSFNNRDKPGKTKMPGPVLVGLAALQDWLLAEPSLVVGDFNNHERWDKPHDKNSFARHLDALNGMGFRSAWHHLSGVPHGKETVDTHLWRVGMSYHIDYAFAQPALLADAACHIEPLDAWCGPCGLSDHAPLVLELG